MKKNFLKTGSFRAVFDESVGLWEIDQFVENFRQQAAKNDELIIDLNLSKTGCWKIFLAKYVKIERYH